MAELTAYSGIANLMRSELDGCEIGPILAALYRAGRKFCEDTEVWVRDIEETLVEGQATYDLAQTGSRVQRVIRVRFVDEDAGGDPNTWSDGLEIHPDRYRLADDNLIFDSAGTPGADYDGQTLAVRVADVPHTDTDPLPDGFLTRWADAIRYLAMEELRRQPNRPWADRDDADRYALMYYEQMSIARGEKAREHKSVDLIARAPSFI